MNKPAMTPEGVTKYLLALHEAGNHPPKPDEKGPRRDAFYDGLGGVNAPTDPVLFGYWEAGWNLRSPAFRPDAGGNADWIKDARR